MTRQERMAAVEILFFIRSPCMFKESIPGMLSMVASGGRLSHGNVYPLFIASPEGDWMEKDILSAPIPQA
jgi:hypothetical protein